MEGSGLLLFRALRAVYEFSCQARMVAAEALERPARKEFLGAEVKRGCQNDERLARTNKFCRKHWKSPGALISHADEIIEKKQTQPMVLTRQRPRPNPRYYYVYIIANTGAIIQCLLKSTCIRM